MNSLVCILMVLSGVWTGMFGGASLVAIAPNTIPGDFDGSGQVTLQDFNMFRGKFGTTEALYDLDGNGYVGLGDWNIFRANFGKYLP